MGKHDKLIIDKEIHEKIPPLGVDESRQLEENIKADGCRDPLVVWRGKDIIVDGRNRYEICNRLKIKFDVVEREFSSKVEARIWALQNQRGRRNVNDFQRTEMELELKQLVALEAKERQAKGGREKVSQNSDEPLRTDEKIASVSGVSRDTVRKVERVIDSAIPAIQEMARANEISINAAAAAANAPKADQKKAAAAGVAAVKELAKEVREEKKSEDEKPAEDETGKKITAKKCAAAFALRKRGMEIRQQLISLKKDVMAYANELGGYYDAQDIGQRLGESITWMRDNLPHAVCRKCDGRACAACSQTGWQSLYRWNTVVDPEFKK